MEKRQYKKLDLSAKVVVIVDENPKKLNSKSWERYNIYLALMEEKGEFTVGEFIEAGGLAGDIRYDLDKNHIELVTE